MDIRDCSRRTDPVYIIHDYELEIPLIGPLLKKVVARLMRDNTQRLLEAVKTRAEQPQ